MKNIFGYFVGVLLFLVFFPALMYAVAVNFVVPVDSLIVSTVGAIFVLIGAVFMVWSNIDMVKIGRGCPTDGFNIALGERTKKLIVQGPYKYTRNPMLFGTFVFYVGLALLFNSYSALIVPIVFISYMVWHVKKFEEPRLYNDFKDEYVEYKKRTPLLFPKFKK
jgi:protein-S-isoprenylcysteine O-methyltransferase Ste14